MSFFSLHHLTELLHDYGYGLVGLVVGLEAMGLPLPGESLVIAAALYAGSTHQLSIPFVVAAAAAGAIIGDNIGYWIGREFGLRLLVRYGRYIRMTERRIKLGRYLFRLHGGKVVFFGRFVAVLRALAALLAGINGMDWWRFLLFNAAGGAGWASLYGFGAYFLGRAIDRLAGPVGVALGVTAAIAVVVGLVFLRRNEQRLEDLAEAAYPGPLDARRRARGSG